MRKGKDADHRVCSGRVGPSPPTGSRAHRLVAVLLATAVAVFMAFAPAAAGQEPVSPEHQEIGLLFAQTAKRGTLKPVKGKPWSALELHGVARQVVWFSDRPARQTGHIPIRGFVQAWAGFGFEEVSPNAALTVLDAENHEDTVVLELGQPRYRKKTETVRYPVRFLDAATGNLAHFEPQRDGGIPRHFRSASLFIDDATARVVNGCVIQPWTSCPGANLDSARLGNVNLNHADLSHAVLSYATFDGADLTGANLSHVTARFTSFNGTALRWATLAGSDLNTADLRGADLFDANLDGALLEHATFLDAYLVGARLTRVVAGDTDFGYSELSAVDFTSAIIPSDPHYFRGARFCNTIMPNGSENNTGC